MRHWGLWPPHSTWVVFILLHELWNKKTVVIFTLSCAVCTWRELTSQRSKKYSDYVEHIHTFHVRMWDLHCALTQWILALRFKSLMFFGCKDAVQSMRQQLIIWRLVRNDTMYFQEAWHGPTSFRKSFFHSIVFVYRRSAHGCEINVCLLRYLVASFSSI